jgi:cystathionine beta-lyase
MDFPIAPVVAEALRRLVDRHELGYPNWGGPDASSPAARLFPQRMAERHGWECDPSRVRDLADVLQGVRATVLHCSRPGDGVVLHLPAYHPFLGTIEGMDRRLVPVHFDSERRAFDYERLDDELTHAGARVWILCHPHNPLGHVFERPELERIAELAAKHGQVTATCRSKRWVRTSRPAP